VKGMKEEEAERQTGQRQKCARQQHTQTCSKRTVQTHTHTRNESISNAQASEEAVSRGPRGICWDVDRRGDRLHHNADCISEITYLLD